MHVLQKINQHKYILGIFVIAIIVRIIFARIDPYLHEWDERFHALVAKNLMDNPLVPLLRKSPLVPYDANSWCCNSIWLHKQPVFLWQMALSMKLFGVSEFTMRLPSVLMGALMILLVFRIAILLTDNKQTSYIAALIMCFSNYQLEQTSGLIGMDHNDIAFGFYILASIWAFCEKTKSKKLHWPILIGVFAGLAVLNKWLVGFLIYLPWFVLIVKELLSKKSTTEIKPFLISFFVALLVFLPWQIYILTNFYDLAMYEYKVNNEHLWNAVHGHIGDKYYYWNKFSQYFGPYLYTLVPIGLLLSFFKNKNSTINFSIAFAFVFVFLFFSLIVQTKLPSYFFVVAPIGYIMMAQPISYLLQLHDHKAVKILCITGICYLELNPQLSYAARQNNSQRDNLIHNTEIYKTLEQRLPKGCKTVINVNTFEDIDVMFYNDGLTAYQWWIEPKYLDSLSQNKIPIAAFKNRNDYNLPAAYQTYPYLSIIDIELK